MGGNKPILGRPPSIKECYQEKVNRDRRAKALKLQGYEIIRRSSRNQNMHPDYIKDYDGEGKNSGFGPDTYYRTFFAVVYIVEATKKEVLLYV